MLSSICFSLLLGRAGKATCDGTGPVICGMDRMVFSRRDERNARLFGSWQVRAGAAHLELLDFCYWSQESADISLTLDRVPVQGNDG